MAVLLVTRGWGARARIAVLLLEFVMVPAACRTAALDVGEERPAAPWWKGNTHTHSLWSDGAHYPEMVADWYKRHGYHFLAMTDHDPPPPEKWVTLPAEGVALEGYADYLVRFGPEWVEERRDGDTTSVRLRTLEEYRGLLEEPDRFILIDGEEITQYLDGKAAHVNVINPVEPIPPQQGSSTVEILQRDIDAIRAQRERTGQPMIGVLNHPNFIWSQTAEDLLQLPGLRFFEVYNGHPLVNNPGDALHAGTERMWDIVLTTRARRGEPPLYGVATDDAHDYMHVAADQRNPGRGWIFVRAAELTANAIVLAMERGDFYASTGVELMDLQSDRRRIALAINPVPGVSYRTQFVGTRIDHDTTSVAVHDTTGAALTRRYSDDVGEILAEVAGTTPGYTLRGDELYVRARVISSRAKTNPVHAGEMEMAWTQPVWP